MTALEDKLTIMVCTCDSYEDLWHPFFKLFYKYWTDCNLNIVLNTETKKYNYKSLKIKSYPQERKEKYGERMIRNLNEITTKYTLLLLDDFFLRREVDVRQLTDYLSLMDLDSKITAIYFTRQGLNQVESCNYDGLEKLKQYAMYKLNMQAGLWRTERLKNYWNAEDDPWKWEIFANFNTFKSKEFFLQIANQEETPFYYGYDSKGMGVFRGKWVLDDVKPLFEKNNIVVDYTQRGIYQKESEKKYFSNKCDLLIYMLKRIPVKFTAGFIIFYCEKWIMNMLDIDFNYKTYSDKLIKKEEKINAKKKNTYFSSKW